MPVKLYSQSGLAKGKLVPATEEDKAMLIRANTHPPGIRGMLRIPVDPIYIATILFINLFCYACVIFDFTVEFRQRLYMKDIIPMDEGSCRRFIFCMDFIILIDVLLGICHRKAKMIPARSIIIITIDFISLAPYEMIYVVLKGSDMRIYFALRLRYVLRLFRYVVQACKAKSFKLSLVYVMSIYIIAISVLCMLSVCIRLQIYCLGQMEGNVDISIIRCENLTIFDVAFTYAILNGQISYSGLLFVNDPFAHINHLDSILQMIVKVTLYILIPKMICILLENNQYKYAFCLTGNHALKAMRAKKKRRITELFKHEDDRVMTFLRQYMASYWKHYQIENIQSSYVGNYKAATIPAVIYSEITLDFTWDMFKHSILFRKENAAFLRQLSKLTVFSFGTKYDIIYQQGKTRSIMVYIIKGIVSLMGETTGRTPLMSFSGGTVFGELSLFLNVPSSTTIYCNTYCEYMVLSRVDFLKMRQIYPEIYNKLRAKCLKRVDYARNYHFIAKQMYQNGDIKLPKSETSLRYIKTALRCYMNTPESPLNQSIFIPEHMTPEASLKSTIFNARFIPLYVEAGKIESNFTTHFSVSGINFKLKQSSTLYRIWRFWISFLTLTDCIFYPLGAAQDTALFTNIYDYFVIGVNIFYILDFLSYNFVSIKDHGRVIVASEEILMHKIQKIGFWFDLVACIPIEVFCNLMQNELHPFNYRLLGITRLIKINKIIVIIDNYLTFSSVLLILLPIAKSIYGVIMLLFFGYLVFHRFGYFDQCNLGIADKDMTFWMKLQVVYQFYVSMGDVGMEVHRDINLLPLIVIQIVGFYALTHTLCTNAAAIALIYMPTVNYENLIDDIKRIFVLFKFPYGPRKKMSRFLKLLNDADKPADAVIFHKMMGKALFKEHCINMHYDFISRLQLFVAMSKPALHNMCEIAEVQFVPRGELIVIAGSLVNNIYFIMKGQCEVTLKRGAGGAKSLGVGDTILLFEAFLGFKALTNVIAITDCQLLCFSVTDLRRKLVKYPIEMYDIMNAVGDSITKQQLGELKTIEPRATAMMEESPSCRYFDHLPVQFREGFGYFRYLAILFMKHSITPFGRFWFSWEITHISITFFYVFVGTIPITVSSYTMDYWFWIFRLLDIFYFVDIYLRHHVVFFNQYKVEVQHPWKCAKHYWKTNFVLEVIATIPLELIVLPTVTTFDITYLSMLRINRYLRLLRLRGLIKFLNFRYMKTYKLVVILTYACLSLIIYNLLLVLLFQGDTVVIRYGQPIFNDGDVFEFWRSYTSKLFIAIKQICNIGINEGFTSAAQLWIHVFMNALGQIIILSLSCIIIAMSLFRRMYLMTFQIKMQRLVMFMNIRKIDKSLRSEIIKYYEYLWTLREGKSLIETLRTFSPSLTQEIIYSYYAPSLQKTLLFMDYPKVILKDILAAPSITREMFLITGVVIRVNDVQDRIFIIYNGQVQVLGPDFSYLRDLRVGSIFGCLDNVQQHRSTLTYVAKTHCEFLSIPSVHFHEIMSKYPRYYQFYMKMLNSSNFDYLPCGGRSGKKNPDTMSVDQSIMTGEIPSRSRARARLAKFFPVMKEREYVKIIFAIYIVIAFQFECMLITFLFHYFTAVVYIAYGLDIIFWIKMYFDFSTEYENRYGLKIRNRRRIAIKYSSEFFGAFFHIAANFPFEIIVLVVPSGWYRHLWAYLRCNRLLKIILVFKYLHSVRNRLNINVRLIKSLDILLILYTTQQLSIIVLSQFIDEQFYYLDALIFHSYFISKSVYTPFKNGIPEFTNTVLYKLDYIVVLLATQLVCIVVLADSVATYHMLNFSRFRYETFLNDQENVMKLMNVSPPLLQRVKLYCRSLITRGLNVQFPAFIIDAPYYLREGVLDAMFGFHLRAHPVFKLCHTDFNRQVAATFKTLYFFEGDFVVFQGDIDKKMYFIHAGEIEGLVEDNIYFDVADSRYFAGDYFGFHQLIFSNVGHTKTYKVVSKMAMLISVKRQHVTRLLEFFPASKFLFFNQNTPNDDLDDAHVEYRDYLKYTNGIHE